MRGFQEIKGQSIRLAYDRERADFLVKTEPHPFVVREPAIEVQAKRKHCDRRETARRRSKTDHART
jgi:hypothetical protein